MNNYSNSLTFKTDQIQFICELFSEISGNKFGLEKKHLIESRLRKRIIDLQIDIKSYLDLIQKNEEERTLFISALTTHKTDWFREYIHFEFLLSILNSNLSSVQNSYIWSAACSYGHEPYSLALFLLKNNFNKFKILSTDISHECLHFAMNGEYNTDEIPNDIYLQYFSKLNRDSNTILMNDDIKKHLKWRELNLIHFHTYPKIKFNIIFLRNVLIYFETEVAEKIVSNITNNLQSGGYLILGLSESIYNPEKFNLVRVENSIFQKK